ncbi:hypothetical protein K458DRAFT_454727 [Lentithecium fluviatile CBS 122367]|uniref:ubiquitinyl hydrolase 1 n=1 Tax=Lentithecium fluviatile CBS 122367 TaxID=1168545 RepID=A0A6G1JJE2_9PLEO|nr:hypothetical protein K458DRAFT_454727 [Lentithecium fluviatile CBS 122367]
MNDIHYQKHFIPLESNPEVFTKLSHKLGVAEALSFVDIWALDEVEHLPRLALALGLVFPTSNNVNLLKILDNRSTRKLMEMG